MNIQDSICGMIFVIFRLNKSDVHELVPETLNAIIVRVLSKIIF